MAVVNLSVHRNTRDQRERHRVRNMFKQDAKTYASRKIDGFVIIVWDKNCDAECSWHSGETMPGSVMPEFVKKTIERATSIRDAREVVWGPDDEA